MEIVEIEASDIISAPSFTWEIVEIMEIVEIVEIEARGELDHRRANGRANRRNLRHGAHLRDERRRRREDIGCEDIGCEDIGCRVRRRAMGGGRQVRRRRGHGSFWRHRLERGGRCERELLEIPIDRSLDLLALH